jgi:methylase of polypeptide subunit release factors
MIIKGLQKPIAFSYYDCYLYDKLTSLLAKWLIQAIVDCVQMKSTVLEIGCGPGTLALALSARCSKIVATDISNRAVEYAKL